MLAWSEKKQEIYFKTDSQLLQLGLTGDMAVKVFECNYMFKETMPQPKKATTTEKTTLKLFLNKNKRWINMDKWYLKKLE
jgi:hypothetical protein